MIQNPLTTEEISMLSTEMNRVSNNLTLTHDALKHSESPADRYTAKCMDEDYNGLTWRLNQSNEKTSIPKLQSLPYANELIISKKVLQENIWRFPKNSCEIASKVVNEVTGLEQVAGDCKYDSKSFHSWNFDFERELFICISMDQYGESNDQVTVLPANMDILTVQEIPTKNQWLYDRADIQDYITEIKSRIGNN